MFNIDMDAIKSRTARVVRDEHGKIKVFNTAVVDDAVALIAEVERLTAENASLALYKTTGMTPGEIIKQGEDLMRARAWGDKLAHMMADAIRTREKVKDKLRKQARHTTRARKQRDALKAEIVAMREELAAVRAVVSKTETTTANFPLTLQEVLALPEGARVYLEYREPSRGCVAKKETAYGKAFICAVGGEMHGLYGLNAEYLIGGDKPRARVWHLPVAPTEDELAKYPWEVRNDG